MPRLKPSAVGLLKIKSNSQSNSSQSKKSLLHPLNDELKEILSRTRKCKSTLLRPHLTNKRDAMLTNARS